jgi:hypothetical protein
MTNEKSYDSDTEIDKINSCWLIPNAAISFLKLGQVPSSFLSNEERRQLLRVKQQIPLLLLLRNDFRYGEIRHSKANSFLAQSVQTSFTFEIV